MCSRKSFRAYILEIILFFNPQDSSQRDYLLVYKTWPSKLKAWKVTKLLISILTLYFRESLSHKKFSAPYGKYYNSKLQSNNFQLITYLTFLWLALLNCIFNLSFRWYLTKSPKRLPTLVKTALSKALASCHYNNSAT